MAHSEQCFLSSYSALVLPDDSYHRNEQAPAQVYPWHLCMQSYSLLA